MGMLLCEPKRLRRKLEYADYILGGRDQELHKKLGRVTGGSTIFAYIFAAYPMKESRRRALMKADVKDARGIVSTHLMSAARAFYVPDRPIREYRRAKNKVKRLNKQEDPESKYLLDARFELKEKEWQLAVMTCENGIRKQNDNDWC